MATTKTSPKFKVGEEVRCIYKDQAWKGAIVEITSLHENGVNVVIVVPGEHIDAYVPGTTGHFELRHLEKIKQKDAIKFETVIIADDKRQQIIEALQQIDKSGLIFDTWGFGETIEKGKGVSMLFYGPPGTGKTLMAQAIADKLEHKLKIIATADVQASMPGQAERNIREHFGKAKGKKVILLFDECDSLLFSRTHVGPIMAATVNELLSQLERFEGITIFTTNRLGTLDDAVNRRLALKLEFSMPTREERAKIWERMMPKKAPLASDIDFGRLAGVELAGGHIKNAVLRAARMAAIEDKPDKHKQITQSHLTKALAQEAKALLDFERARNEHEGELIMPRKAVHDEYIGGS